MCYVVLLSTSSPADLSADSNALVRFENPRRHESLTQSLHHPYKWYVGSSSGCSCSFRHLLSSEMGFGKPEPWFPEEPENLEATRAFVMVVRNLLSAGHKVDCLNSWNAVADGELTSLEVDLNRISDEEFRFFENYHFHFTSAG